MTEEFGIECHGDDRFEIERAQRLELAQARIEKMFRVRARRALGPSALVNFLLRFAAGDAVIFQTGEARNFRRRIGKDVIGWEIETRVAIKFAIDRRARVTRLRAPDFPARDRIAREGGGPSRGEAGRVDGAARPRFCEGKRVRVENKPAQILRLQQRFQAGRVGAFREPEADRVRVENAAINVTTDSDLRTNRFARRRE